MIEKKETNQSNLDSLLKRVRAARNCGQSQAEVEKHFVSQGFSEADIFLTWHAACILDRDF